MIFILSAPSGTGKTTILDILNREYGIPRQVTCTTREPRQGEKNGLDYYFVGREEFQRLVAEDLLAEWALVYGEFYGTLKKTIQKQLSLGRPVILALDTQGAARMRNLYREKTVLIGLLPPSKEELGRRLRSRGRLTGEKEASWRERLDAACQEMALIEQNYDYLIVNEKPEKAAASFYKIIRNAEKKNHSPDGASPGKGGCKPGSS